MVPRSVVAALSGRRVRAELNGTAYEATLGTYGGRTFLGLRKQLLTELGLAAGDQVHVRLEALPDDPTPVEPPTPQTCPELEGALTTDPTLADAWSRLAPAAQAEYGRWIAAGAEPEDRRSRIARMRRRLVPEA